MPTLCDAAAKAALEAAPSLHELHVWTHVGLAAITADRAALAVVHQVRRVLKGDEITGEPPHRCSPHGNDPSSHHSRSLSHTGVNNVFKAKLL